MNYLHRTHGVVIAETIHAAAEALRCDVTELTRLEEVSEARYVKQRGTRKRQHRACDVFLDVRSDG